MNEIRVLSTTAILGYGFPLSSFERGMSRKPQVIAADAGSTDPGPAYLGLGKSFVDRAAVKRDLEIMIKAGITEKIPVIVGTAGGSGAKAHTDWCLEIIKEIIREHKLRARLALIYSDVPKSKVRKALKKRKIHPLPFVPELTEESIAATRRIVAQIGVEPLIDALKEPVDILLVGRCYDPAVFAALPISQGYNPGLALHMGKVLECAAIAATPGSGRDCVLGVLSENEFTLETLSDDRRFTVSSVAAHTLYEKSHPYILHGPGGHLDLSRCDFTQVTENSVRVTGSEFIPSTPYRLKLEGARQVGFRTIAIAGVRDSTMLRKLDEVYAGVRSAVENNFGKRKYRLNFRTYGRDAVMGPLEPQPNDIGHEVGIIFDVVADTQAEADTICGFARSTALHFGYSGRIATAGNLAFPFSPSDISMGPVYEFSIYHLVDVEDPCAWFPVKRMELGA